MNSWANIKTIAKRELGAYFTSPLAYVFIVIFLLLCGFFTFMIGGFFERGQATLAQSFFDWHPWFYLFLVPAVGMRLWAEERRLFCLGKILRPCTNLIIEYIFVHICTGRYTPNLRTIIGFHIIMRKCRWVDFGAHQ